MTNKPMSVWIGVDMRQSAAYAVARETVRKFDRHIPINGVVLSELQGNGLYTRPTERRLGKLWDVISGNYMSTEFAISRFLVPEIIRRRDPHQWHVGGWALFTDCDVMFRENLVQLRMLLDDDKALMCVKHDHKPMFNVKMDGQEQVGYPRKNWSSVMAINLDHPSNKALNSEMVNAMPGLKLHQFCWLNDDEIGELPPAWNYLVGHTEGVDDPHIVHFTDGGPWLESFRNVEYADEWLHEYERWAR